MYLFNDDKSKAEIKVIEGHSHIGPTEKEEVTYIAFPSDAVILSLEAGSMDDYNGIVWHNSAARNVSGQTYNFPTAFHRQDLDGPYGTLTIILYNPKLSSQDIYYRLVYLLRG